MGTGYRGTFVISWAQTELDARRNPPRAALRPGALWCWLGEALRIDGPASILPLLAEPDAARLGAARALRGIADAIGHDDPDQDAPLSEDRFRVTDGQQVFCLTLIDTGARPLLMVQGALPPRDIPLWVVDTPRPTRERRAAAPPQAAMPGLARGTRIATPSGPRPIETLEEGDMVATRDAGPQPLQWVGRSVLGGAQLYDRPGLRPVRIDTGAFGMDRPDRPLLVAPGQRLLLRGAHARALFNCDEVLATTVDLLDGRRIRPDHGLRAVTYWHLLLPDHAVIFANGVQTESLHPAQAALDDLDAGDRLRLRLCLDPRHSGPAARRILTTPETAILLHKAA
ncbi:Hint domain-containing protein [Thetidibacter halocola]|uniref:Hint domain-containing protein n=1 Tax=Thetidibacter halocola TaxID=2827239 RepID=A0A8J7W9F4_9RHOB|nr:Hint domain-containing protein [Thetidibacter halocola]MBS0123400.1 Hint domain-containing protein [Thetidibacter halocola]